MSTEDKPSTGYTVSVRFDGARFYDCVMCSHSAPDLDGARAHHAAHVAGPDIISALHFVRENTGADIIPLEVQRVVKEAIAKAEPKGQP